MFFIFASILRMGMIKIENTIINLENVVREDMTLDDAKRMVREDPFIGYSLEAWDEMIKESDATWHTQLQDSLMRMIPFGRMRLIALWDDLAIDAQINLNSVQSQIEMMATGTAALASTSQKEFNMRIGYPIRETGVEDQILFNGWKLAHFEKITKFHNSKKFSVEKTNWDFVLGADGKIYHITSGYFFDRSNPDNTPDTFFYDVRRAIYFDTGFLMNQNKAYFIAISHGILITVDQILQNPQVASGKFVTSIKEDYHEYIFNFPLEPNGSEEPIDLHHLLTMISSITPEGILPEDVGLMVEKYHAERREKEQKEKEDYEREQKRRAEQKLAKEKEDEERWKREMYEQNTTRIEKLERKYSQLNMELENTKGIFSVKQRKLLKKQLDRIRAAVKYLKGI